MKKYDSYICKSYLYNKIITKIFSTILDFGKKSQKIDIFDKNSNLFQNFLINKIKKKIFEASKWIIYIFISI